MNDKPYDPLRAVADGRLRWMPKLGIGDRTVMALAVLTLISSVLLWFTSGWPGNAMLSVRGVRDGNWLPLIWHMFAHAGLIHLLANLSVFGALGADFLRFFPNTIRSSLVFVGVYLACGIAGGLTFLLLHPYGTAGVVGASGALFGLWGAITRFVAADWGFRALGGKDVLANFRAVLVSNTILFILVGGLFSLTGGGGGLAWEAHLGGFLAGMLLAPYAVRLAKADAHLASLRSQADSGCVVQPKRPTTSTPAPPPT